MYSCVEAIPSSGCCLHSCVNDHAVLGRPQTPQEGCVGPGVQEVSQVDLSTHQQWKGHANPDRASSPTEKFSVITQTCADDARHPNPLSVIWSRPAKVAEFHTHPVACEWGTVVDCLFPLSSQLHKRHNGSRCNGERGDEATCKS